MALNYLAAAPYASFVTRNGAFQADGNGLISNVGTGAQALDLFTSGCVPLAFNHFANFRNLIDGGDFSINPFQRNIPGLAAGGVIATPIGATPTYFADRFFAAGGASSAILMAAVADGSIAGFNQSLKISRQAGNASSATINVGQALETLDSLRCQGQTVTLSFWAKAGANYSGGALTVQVIAGGGVNQSAASLIAGTWTSASYVVNAAQALTSAMTRYQFTGVVPPRRRSSPCCCRSRRAEPRAPTTPCRSTECSSRSVRARRRSSTSTPRSPSRSVSAMPGPSRNRRRAL